MDLKDNETLNRLTGLSLMIRQVYLPLMEQRTEIRMHMDKFVRQISTSIQQAYGNVTIKVPNVPLNLSDEEICKNRSLIEDYQNTVVSILTGLYGWFCLVEGCFRFLT